jgi:D-inositol-3-phosphate glycosyltransferase
LRDEYDVAVLALNYLGDPHQYSYPIYPAFSGGDGFGLGRIDEILKLEKPDLVIVQNDPWNIPAYLDKIDGRVPVVAVVAVDGKNCRGAGLNRCAHVIFWTQFGLDEARLGGYTGPASIVPLGVDTDLFRPVPQIKARAMLFGEQVDENTVNLSQQWKDAFIVGNVNRNQPRKRLDLTVEYFAEWVKEFKVDNAWLYVHVAPTGDAGYDIHQLMRYYGFTGKNKRLIIVQPGVRHGVPDAVMVATYNTFDVSLSTTQGEGFGLTALEAMACGVPVVVPKWAALEEICAGAGELVRCSSTAVTPNYINVVGGIMDKRDGIAALNRLYREPQYRRELGECGRQLAIETKYRWSSVGSGIKTAVDSVLCGVAA